LKFKLMAIIYFICCAQFWPGSRMKMLQALAMQMKNKKRSTIPKIVLYTLTAQHQNIYHTIYQERTTHPNSTHHFSYSFYFYHHHHDHQHRVCCAVLRCTVLSSFSLCHLVRHPVIAELHPTVLLLVVVVKDVIIVVVSSSSSSFLVRFIFGIPYVENRMISKHTNLAIAIVVVVVIVAILLIVDEILL